MYFVIAASILASKQEKVKLAQVRDLHVLDEGHSSAFALSASMALGERKLSAVRLLHSSCFFGILFSVVLFPSRWWFFFRGHM
jgi:hypothetical protein